MPPNNGNGNGNGNAGSGLSGTETTTIEVNGFSIIGNPAKTNAPAANGGALRLHSGDDVFEADDIVVFTVENVTVDGVLTDDSVITKIEVYESSNEFLFGSPKFTYLGEAEIDVGRKTMGDRYLEFKADGLESSDAGAPELVELTVVAGVNIQAELDANGKFDVPTIEDIDTDGDGTPDDTGDGQFSSDVVNELLVVCFGRGTLIDTPEGPRFVETLKAGDLVNTLDDGPQPIKWIGSRRVPGYGSNAPVRIKAGALGNLRALTVSQNHRMMVRGAAAELLFGESEVLVAAKHLINDDTIRVVRRAEINYVHFLFDKHQIVFAEGCPAESLYPGTQALGVVEEESRDEILALFPELRDDIHVSPMSRYALKHHEALAFKAIA